MASDYTEVLVNLCRSRVRRILRRFCWPRIMQGDKYLSASPNCQISEIEDIGDTIEVESDEELPNAAKCVNGYIRAVVSCDHYASCVNCSAKLPGVSEADEYDIVECEKCQSKTLKSRCDQGTVCRVIFEKIQRKFNSLYLTMLLGLLSRILICLEHQSVISSCVLNSCSLQLRKMLQ